MLDGATNEEAIEVAVRILVHMAAKKMFVQGDTEFLKELSKRTTNELQVFMRENWDILSYQKALYDIKKEEDAQKKTPKGKV